MDNGPQAGEQLISWTRTRQSPPFESKGAMGRVYSVLPGLISSTLLLLIPAVSPAADGTKDPDPRLNPAELRKTRAQLKIGSCIGKTFQGLLEEVFEVSLAGQEAPPPESIVPGEVELIWWTKPRDPLKTHVELSIEGTLYNSAGTFARTGTLASAERLAEIRPTRAFVGFSLKVSPEELQRLKHFYEKHEGQSLSDFQSCISGACHAIHSSTGFKVPWPFSAVPSLAAIYLTSTHYLGFQRITEIRVVNPSKKPLFFSQNLLGESLIVAGGAYLASKPVMILQVSLQAVWGEIEEYLVQIEDGLTAH